MAIALKLSDELIDLAEPYAAAEHRSAPNQIAFDGTDAVLVDYRDYH